MLPFAFIPALGLSEGFGFRHLVILPAAVRRRGCGLMVLVCLLAHGYERSVQRRLATDGHTLTV